MSSIIYRGLCFILNTLGLSDLVMLAAKPTTSGSALTECLKFLIKTLKLAEKSPNEAHLNALSNQVASLSNLPPDRLGTWLKRLVVGSSADSATEVAANMSLLHKFVELLTSPDWYANKHCWMCDSHALFVFHMLAFMVVYLCVDFTVECIPFLFFQ